MDLEKEQIPMNKNYAPFFDSLIGGSYLTYLCTLMVEAYAPPSPFKVQFPLSGPIPDGVKALFFWLIVYLLLRFEIKLKSLSILQILLSIGVGHLLSMVTTLSPNPPTWLQPTIWISTTTLVIWSQVRRNQKKEKQKKSETK